MNFNFNYLPTCDSHWTGLYFMRFSHFRALYNWIGWLNFMVGFTFRSAFCHTNERLTNECKLLLDWSNSWHLITVSCYAHCIRNLKSWLGVFIFGLYNWKQMKFIISNCIFLYKVIWLVLIGNCLFLHSYKNISFYSSSVYNKSSSNQKKNNDHRTFA